MAEVWEAGSTVKLVFVPWDSSYSDVVAFSSPEEQAAWFGQAACSDPLVMSQATYVRPNEPLTIDGPYSQVHKYNYCIVDNPVQPVDGSEPERLFYFITNAEYASPASTRITLQLDLWQTRVVHDGCTFGNAYLERGHAALAQIKYRQDVDGWGLSGVIRRFCLVPEDLDVGDSYITSPVYVEQMQTGVGYVVLSTADLTAQPGTVSAPNLETAKGGFSEDLPTGATAYLITSQQDFTRLMTSLSAVSWVAQCIIGIYFLPAKMFGSYEPSAVQLFNGVTAYTNWVFSDYYFTSPNPLHNGNAGDMGVRYEGYTEYTKLLTYPYCAYELTAFDGKSLILKPQYLNDAENISFRVTGCALPPFIRVGCFPQGYGGFSDSATVTYNYVTPSGRTAQNSIGGGDWLDSALWMSDFPQFATVNNNYTTYLASTANTREYNYQSAGWSRSASLASANTANQISQMGIATNSANQAIQNQLTDKQQFLGVLQGGVNAVGSLLSGNIGGAASGAISTGLNYLSGELSQQANNATFANNQQLASYTADANMRLAEYTANGNYQNAIAGINATVQDAALTPPSQIGQQGGNGYRAKQGYYAWIVRCKVAAPEYQAIACQYWQRYGYAVHEWIMMPDALSDLCVMSYNSYWKCQDMQVTCATANDTEIQAIQGIFSRGVTVYRNPGTIGHLALWDNTCVKALNCYVQR